MVKILQDMMLFSSSSVLQHSDTLKSQESIFKSQTFFLVGISI